jgi:nitrile hydratase beta subunit
MPVLTKDMVPGLVATGGSCRVDADVPPRFAPGDQIIARNLHPARHTRLPRYVRGKRGAVERDHGVFVFPDSSAHGEGEKPQHVYSVKFSARELWGPDASPKDHLYIDLWDDYMDRA